ncbi:MAG TPA: RagB/SusD family nutrient uptake outer membrane protein [Bacteroidales bacterium]|nr:RagB/SusD family nutrient uptake outer membrane protein [Bacteroidales bacterium]
MKKTIYLLLLSILLPACEVLNLEPESKISDRQAITDASSLETAVYGMYARLHNNDYYGLTFQSVGYLPGDNVKWTGSYDFLSQFDANNVRADNTQLPPVFTGIYRTVNCANQVISASYSLADPQLSASNRKLYRGEAYFVRALSYFDLSRLWGGVQLITEPTLSSLDNKGIRRSSLQETRLQVLTDLDSAEVLLPETTNRNRATRKTVFALKARLYLYMNDWNKAELYASKLISDSNYELIAPYSSFFANNVKNTKESILELAYSATDQNSHSQWWQPPVNSGRREWAPTDELVNLLNDPLTGGNRKTMIARTAAPGNLWYGNMYYRNPRTDPAFVLRIAEMYLIRAEARAQLSKIPEGLMDLNAVRARAGLVPAAASTIEELLLATEQERRLEFAFEPHRWFDLVRTVRLDDVLGVTDRTKWVMPIPVTEIQASEGIIEQNEGY